MKRIFLDANVLFTAAHNSKGKAAWILSPTLTELNRIDGTWDFRTSNYAVEEAYRNLQKKYPECLKKFENYISCIYIHPSGNGSTCPLSLPGKDKPIFESAIQTQSTHLLTGDMKDFGRFMNKPEETKGIIIQTVAEFIDEIKKRKSTHHSG